MESIEKIRWTHYYLRALSEPENGAPFTTTIEHLGEIKLYVHLDKKAPNRWAKMRKPRILVQDHGDNALSGYAAVLVCDNDKGNAFLASMEDPAHSRWHHEEAEGWTSEEKKRGEEALKAMRKWVSEILQSLASRGQADKQDVVGLADFLPAEEDNTSEETLSAAGTGTDAGQADPETGLEVPARVSPRIEKPRAKARRPQRATRNLSDPEVDDIDDGRGTEDSRSGSGSGSGEEQGGGLGKEAGGSPEDGDGAGQGGGAGLGDSKGGGERVGPSAGPNPNGRGGGNVSSDNPARRPFREADVGFRSFALSSGGYRVVLHGKRKCEGDLALCVVAEDATWRVDVLSARSGKRTFDATGNVVHGIALKRGETLTLDLVIDAPFKVSLGMAR